jgi:hypothetical protein
MTADKCWVAGCDRGALASVTREDLPGSLRLCATHTEQFRQSSDGWAISWPAGSPVPSSVTAPGSEVLWAYRPGGGSTEAVTTAEAPERRGLSRWAGWPRRK